MKVKVRLFLLIAGALMILSVPTLTRSHRPVPAPAGAKPAVVSQRQEGSPLISGRHTLRNMPLPRTAMESLVFDKTLPEVSLMANLNGHPLPHPRGSYTLPIGQFVQPTVAFADGSSASVTSFQLQIYARSETETPSLNLIGFTLEDGRTGVVTPDGRIFLLVVDGRDRYFLAKPDAMLQVGQVPVRRVLARTGAPQVGVGFFSDTAEIVRASVAN